MVHVVESRAEVVATRVPLGWGPRQVAAVEAFLDRFEVLEPERSREVARRILAWVERDDPQFLSLLPPSTDPVARVLRAFRPEPGPPSGTDATGNGDVMPGREGERPD